MKTTVLLSAARHPVSGREALARLEAQAIALATRLGGDIRGLHAGPESDALREALGVGLSKIDRIDAPNGSDPMEDLASHLRAAGPDLILAGRRGQGGLDSGLLPYRLAERLGLTLVADAIAIEAGSEAGTVRIDQALKKGDRRRVTVRLPVIVTVHPLAPPPAAFAYGAARRGMISTHPVNDPIRQEGQGSEWEERPYRNRPKLMRTASASSGDAAEKLFVDPDPKEAARLILDYLERNGIRQF
ncbi:electron transfer flavoprotein subunit beta [Fulvimarina endophytica]|uniref:Electron transfer flavoprotein subunit beta n=1 Tax=Fulvimarina endophytica TaxID=2293836 RepID=A0A371X7J4_9HYPH|nr:electron transfer flavoprotein subunit beta [Fulvimarina endophytica]RFC65176.1 electron transfer flavoprotein subunit beta [Fulvimarina endophytica]